MSYQKNASQAFWYDSDLDVQTCFSMTQLNQDMVENGTAPYYRENLNLSSSGNYAQLEIVN